MTLTSDERNMICIYNPGTRKGLIEELCCLKAQLLADETALFLLTMTVLDKLEKMSDAEYDRLTELMTLDIEEDDNG